MLLLSVFALSAILAVGQCDLQITADSNVKEDTKWIQLHEEIVDIYGNLLHALFSQYPEYMKQFTFGVIPLSELSTNPNFKYQIRKTLGFLEPVYRTLDKVDHLYDISKETIDFVKEMTKFIPSIQQGTGKRGN